MFKSITKMAVQVDSTARLPEYLAMAFRKARTGRPGPVYLDRIGKCIFPIPKALIHQG